MTTLLAFKTNKRVFKNKIKYNIITTMKSV